VFIEQNRHWLRWKHVKVLRAIERCRTAALGGHLDECTRCGHRAISYNSCRNRHCPKCQTAARERWIAARQRELLPTRYLHVVFTLPSPAGGLSPDHTRWIHAQENYFLPKKVLRKVFRGKFVDALKQAFHHGQLNFHTDLKLLADPKTFAAWLRTLFRENWVVYLKPPFGGPEYVLHYLGRYTHRVAISNHRLVSFADGQVTFRWRDSADGNKQKLLPLSVNEFLTRFLLHILPQGFVRIRNFGFLANRRRSTLLPLCFQLLGTTPQPPAEEHSSSIEDAAEFYRCPRCGGPMKVIERLTAAEIQLRSPPELSTAA
jgi:hypothetical protein